MEVASAGNIQLIVRRPACAAPDLPWRPLDSESGCAEKQGDAHRRVSADRLVRER